jgi:hypothetical protein
MNVAETTGFADIPLRFSEIDKLHIVTREFLNGLPGFQNYALGGWQLSGITTVVNGSAFLLGSGSCQYQPGLVNRFLGLLFRAANVDSGTCWKEIRAGFDLRASAQPQTKPDGFLRGAQRCDRAHGGKLEQSHRQER